jgi:uncharacterized repeat protein (TIGR03806 family)
MRIRRIAAICGLVSFVINAFSAAPYGLSSRAPIGAYLNGQMPSTRPGVGSGDYTLTDAFPNLAFDDPTFMLVEPGTNRLYVCGRQGTIHWFVNSPGTATKTLFLNVSNRTQGFEDCGLISFAFHPEWRQAASPNRGYIYTWYQYTTNRLLPPPGGDRPNAFYGTWMRLSRFTVPDGQLVADPNSEQVLINQYDRHMWHGGGAMFFGPDGFLYLTVGDEGGIDDEFHQSQKINSGIFSGVLRIDVNRDASRSHPIRRQPQSPPGAPASFTANYYIPNDNPWLDPSGSILEEFWAIGLRSPHRMTFDAVSGRIWQGDIGQNAREEINLIERGANYQWNYREGTITTNGSGTKPDPIIGFDKPPIYDYGRENLDTCVIVGYVYRGTQLPELGGKLIFGDNTSGRIWSLTYNGTNVAPAITYLCNMPPGTDYTGLSSFGLDQNKEIYALQMGSGGKILKLTRTGGPTVTAPALLSGTAAFANTATLSPNPALIPYDVNSALWSDGATKTRWMGVPNNGAPYTTDEQIAFAPTGEWSFPPGTVFVKHFEIATNDANPSLKRRLETRLLVREEQGGVYGVTYKWRANNSDADLVTNSVSENIVITTPSGVRTQTWFYPGPQDCLTCHTPSAGHVLGIKTRQLNGNFGYPSTGITDNQLRALNNVGLFTPAINEANITNYSKLVKVTDTATTLEQRVRSYLDANCAQCHRPGGVAANFDARFDTPLASQNILNGPVNNNFGIAGAREVAPASVAQSIMHLRVNTDGTGKMPPLARNVIDTNFVPVLAEWINSFAPGTLPSPWQNQDIGAVAAAGSAGYTANIATFSVTGSGMDIWANADEFHYAYMGVTGDCEIIARVTSITDTFEWAKAGVMIRESVAANARNAFMALTSKQGAEFQWRDTTGGGSSYVQGPIVSAPSWVRLTRTNSTLTGFSSGDGTNWTQVGNPLTINLPNNFFAGLAVSAVNDGALNTSTFDFVRVNSAATTDSDFDGMPDSFELANGFNRFNGNDAAQDADADGMTNLQEYLAGTNPRNVNSVLRITRVNRFSNDLVLSFLGGTGKTFVIERGTNLPILNWLTLTNVASGANSNVTVTNRNGVTAPREFYRIRVAP